MTQTQAQAYRAPAIDPARVMTCDRVEVRPDVHFAAVVGREMTDPIASQLSQGIYPSEYGLLLGLVEELTPKGGRVLDLGAHIGSFSLACASLGYEVTSVEASPKNASVLQASVDRNAFSKMRLVNAAVSDKPGTLDFCQSGPYGHVLAGKEAGSISVPALAIDDLLAQLGWDRVDFLKIDIEGSEIAGLRGLAKLLSRADAPPIFIESNGHTLHFFDKRPKALKAVLEEFGYTNYLIEGESLRPVSASEPQPTTNVDYLCLKGTPPPSIVGRIIPGLSEFEIVDRLATSSRADNAHERQYAARTLSEVAPELRTSPEVVAAITGLRNDSDGEVRAFAKRIPGDKLLHRIYRKVGEWAGVKS